MQNTHHGLNTYYEEKCFKKCNENTLLWSCLRFTATLRERTRDFPHPQGLGCLSRLMAQSPQLTLGSLAVSCPLWVWTSVEGRVHQYGATQSGSLPWNPPCPAAGSPPALATTHLYRLHSLPLPEHHVVGVTGCSPF